MKLMDSRNESTGIEVVGPNVTKPPEKPSYNIDDDEIPI